MPGRAAYSASKAAVITFMEALRMDLHGTGVHAMAISPGFVHTPMTARLGKLPFAIDTDEAVALMTRAIARRDGTFHLSAGKMRALEPGAPALARVAGAPAGAARAP